MQELKRIKLLLLLNVFLLMVFAQGNDTYSIKGRVADTSGSGLPGVTIYMKSNTKIGTLTDVDGYYSITAKK